MSEPASESTRLACPRLDGGPVPRRATADGPLRLREAAALPPLVDGAPFHVEPLRHFHCPYRVARHGRTVEKVLTEGKGCSHNVYMTTSEAPKVETYKLFASNGRYIRTATRVTFSTGRTVEFMERMSKREAIRQAEKVPA